MIPRGEPAYDPHFRRKPQVPTAPNVVPEEIANTEFAHPPLELLDEIWTSRTVRPETILAALMEQGPGDALQESIEECSALHEAVRYAADCLTAEDIWILNAIQSEGITYEQLSTRLGVSRTQGWRLHRRSIDRLRTLLLNHPPVRERLGMQPTWNAAAMHELIAIAGYDEDWSEPPYELAAAVCDVANAIATAVVQLQAGVELYAVNSLTEAARHAVGFLRSSAQWRLVDMHTLLCSKQHDYGHGNILKFGMQGVMVRASDKGERLKNLLKNLTLRAGLKPANETVKDTFDDVIGYAVIARMLKAETFELELEAPTETSAA